MVGALAGIFIKWGIPPVNSLVVSAIVFVIFELIRKNRGGTYEAN